MADRAQLFQRLDYRWLILSVTSVGSFMSLLDTTMVNVGLQTILTEFHANVQDGQWVITGYTLALSVVIPISGFLAERIGMKRLYMMTMVAFIAGSVLCGLAWDLPSLIFFRILQGLGGGMLQPLGMATVYSVVTPLERPKFMAMLGLPMLVAPLMGPSFGGYLVEYVDWRTMFTINLPIGGIGLLLAWKILREAQPQKSLKLDIPGVVLSTCAFPALILGMTLGSRDGWDQILTQGVLAFGVICFFGWVFVELTQADPMLDLRLFQSPIFRLSMMLNVILIMTLFGTQFLMPLFLQTVQGLGPMEAGMLLVPQGIASFMSMNVSGRLYNRFGPRPLIVSGCLVMALTTYSLSGMGAGASTVLIATMVMARGFAMGFCMMPNQTAAYNTVPQRQMARATALANGLQRIFSSFSSAFLGTVLNNRTFFHYTVMSAQMTAIRPGVEALNEVLQPRMVSAGIVDAISQQKVLAGVLDRQVRTAAASTAFNDAFLMLTMFSLIGAVLALLHRDPVLEQRWADLKAGRPVSQGRGRQSREEPAGEPE